MKPTTSLWRMSTERIRHARHWSEYVVQLLVLTQRAVRKHSNIKKSRFLLYLFRLLPEQIEQLRGDNAGVICLGKAHSNPRMPRKNNNENSTCAIKGNALR